MISGVYINNKDILSMSHRTTLPESPFLHDSGADKRKQMLHCLLPPGFQLFHSDLTVLLLSSRLSRKLRDPETIAHSCIRYPFANFQTNVRSRTAYSKPKRVSEDKPMSEVGAICPNPLPIFEAKHEHSRKLSEEQRKYHESLTSSVISNMYRVRKEI